MKKRKINKYGVDVTDFPALECLRKKPDTKFFDYGEIQELKDEANKDPRVQKNWKRFWECYPKPAYEKHEDGNTTTYVYKD